MVWEKGGVMLWLSKFLLLSGRCFFFHYADWARRWTEQKSSKVSDYVIGQYVRIASFGDC